MSTNVLDMAPTAVPPPPLPPTETHHVSPTGSDVGLASLSSTLSSSVQDSAEPIEGNDSTPQLDNNNSTNAASLNTTVNSTMRLSHIIEKQQKNLIANRAKSANKNSKTPFIVLERVGDKLCTREESENDDLEEGNESCGSGLERPLVKPTSSLDNDASLLTTVSAPSSTSPSESSKSCESAKGKISSLKRLINDVEEEPKSNDIQQTTIITTIKMSSDDDTESNILKPTTDYNRLSRPNSAKRLKRNNVPNPLDLSNSNGQFGNDDDESGPSESIRLDPVIQSAPIRATSFAQQAANVNSGRPTNETVVGSSGDNVGQKLSAERPSTTNNAFHGRRVQYATPYGYYQVYTPVHGRPVRPYPVPLNAPMVYPPHSMANQYQYGQPLQPIAALPQRIPTGTIRRARMPHPHTTTATHFPRHITIDPSRNNNSNTNTNHNNTNTYNNNTNTNANDTNNNTATVGHALTSGSKEDILAEATTPKSNRSKTVTDVFVGDLEKAAPLQSQPLSAQKEYFWLTRNAVLANGSSPYNRTSKEGDEVTESEINEMQDKYRTAAAAAAVSQYSEGKPIKNEVFGSINLMNEKIFNFRIFGKGGGDSASSGESEPDAARTPGSSLEVKDQAWLSKEKQKFLKICETSWDEYVMSRSI